MTTQHTTDTTATMDPGLFDRLRDLLGRPDMIEHCRRATSSAPAAPPARHHTRRAFQDTDLRSWRD